MRIENLPLLCNPYVGEPFKIEKGFLVGVMTGKKFPIINGIPLIYDASNHSKKNNRNRWLHDRSAFAYDAVVSWGEKLKINSENTVRENYIRSLKINSGDRVLETAIGTGTNLAYLPHDIDFFGHDLSIQMLKIAQKNGDKQSRTLELFQGDGAFLPFRDETFDHVFQMGGLQFYEDPFKGVSEMVRTAKSGTTIHILDEISGAMRMLKKMPAHAKYADQPQRTVDAMPRLVPHSMRSIESGSIENSNFYFLRFEKP